MVETWPADDPEAKDPLERHSFERCLADSEYATQHRQWFRWAHRERAHREAASNREAHQREVNEARVAAFEARQAEDRKRAQGRDDGERSRLSAATARIAGRRRRL
jgi:hypothetical protein